MTTATEKKEKAEALIRDTLEAVAKGEIHSQQERVTGTERMVAALALYQFEQTTHVPTRIEAVRLALKLCSAN